MYKSLKYEQFNRDPTYVPVKILQEYDDEILIQDLNMPSSDFNHNIYKVYRQEVSDHPIDERWLKDLMKGNFEIFKIYYEKDPVDLNSFEIEIRNILATINY